MPRLTLPRLLVVACALAFVASLPVLRAADAAASGKSLIHATDLLKLKQLESPALSPDGKWVVYVVRSIEPKPEAKDDWVYHTNLWLVAADGSSAPRQLTRGGSASAPAWSPQGDRIAFVRAVDGKPQIHALPVAGGEAAALTKIETGATAPKWSPDGSRLLFTSSLSYAQAREALEKSGQPAAPRWPVEKPGRGANDTKNYTAAKKGPPDAKSSSATKPSHTAKPYADASVVALAKADGSLQDRREWLAQNEADGNPRALTRLNFQSETDINPDLSIAHLFVQEAREGAEAKDLTPGFTGYVGAEWMTDGKAIVCASQTNPEENPDRSLTASLYLVDAAGGGVRDFLKVPDHSVLNPQPSPDGRWVAFTINRGRLFGYEQAAVGVVPAAGGAHRVLTAKLDRGAGNLKWALDSQSIYFVAASRGGFPLYQVAIDSTEAQTVTAEKTFGVRDYDVGVHGYVQVLTTPENPSELYTGTNSKLGYHALTTHNSDWIAKRQLSVVEEHALTNDKGHTVQYWTLKPTVLERGKKYPLLLQIHGGPSAMWGPGEDSMWFEFQFFAARGYAVVFANPRGSGGYGRDFQAANYRDWGKGPASDVLAAAAEAAKQPFVDPARQVVTGGSYGGYLTAWIVGHDQRFKAAVAQRGVYDLLTFFGEGTAWRLVPLAWGGYPWEPGLREILTEQSPLTYVADIKTPLLIQHGDNDRRTGFVQSEMLLRSLKQLGRDVESVRYPRATHEMSRSGEPRQRLDSLVRYEEFFRRYIGEN